MGDRCCNHSLAARELGEGAGQGAREGTEHSPAWSNLHTSITQPSSPPS